MDYSPNRNFMSHSLFTPPFFSVLTRRPVIAEYWGEGAALMRDKMVLVTFAFCRLCCGLRLPSFALLLLLKNKTLA